MAFFDFKPELFLTLKNYNKEKFMADVMAGIIDDVDEDDQARHMLLARDLLEGAGFIRYEVASYARPGFESMHTKRPAGRDCPCGS